MLRIARIRIAGLCLILIFMQAVMQAQGPGIVPAPGTPVASTRVIQFSGSLDGQPDGPLSTTFALYTDQQSTTPLWTETQTVQVTGGKYLALLGSASSTGVPPDFFADDAAHWLGVLINGVEQRYLLVSVPYAMKAAGADMLGGLAANQYVTTQQLQTALQNLPATTGSSANSPGVLVLRDSTGSFAAGQIFAQNFVGNGLGLTNIPNSATTATTGNFPATIVMRDSTGAFAAGQIYAQNFVGNGTGLANIPNSATTATTGNFPDSIVMRDSTGAFAAGQIFAQNFVGNGTGLANIPNSATTATTGNFPNTIVVRDSQGAFAAGPIFGSFFGNGSGLFNVPASAVGANSSNVANSIVARDVFGAFAAGNIFANGFFGDGSGLTNIRNASTSATSTNTASAIVARDGNGGFSAGLVQASGLNVYNQLTAAGAAVDFSGAIYSAPIKAVFAANTPATCIANRELLIKMDALPGQQLFICNSTSDGYVLVGDGRASGVTSVASGDSSVSVGGSGSAPTISVADGGITSAKLAPNAISAANIADGSLPPAKINGTAAVLGSNTFSGTQTMTGISVNGPVNIQGGLNSSISATNINASSLNGNLSATNNFGTAVTVRGGTATGGALVANSSFRAIDAFSNFSYGLYASSGATGVHADGTTTGVEAQSANGTAVQATITNTQGTAGIPGIFANLGSGKLLSGRAGSGQTEVFNVDTAGNLFATGSLSAQYQNSSGGTVLNELAKLDLNGLAATPITTDSAGVVGIVTGGAGSSGQVQIAYSGVATCLFDHSFNARGDYVGISHSRAGNCSDLGGSYPTSGQVIGRVLQATNGVNNSAPVLLFGPEQRALPGGSISTINTGSGLTGGPITASGTISIANSGVTNSMLQNNSVTITPGTGLSGGGPVALGGSVVLSNTGALSFNGRSGAVVPANGDYSFAQLSGSASASQLPSSVVYNNQSNTFSAPQTINGSLTATSFNGDGSAIANVNAAKVGGLLPADLATNTTLNTESAARQSADSTLQNNLNSESAARQSADTSLSSQISSVSAQSAKLNSANAFSGNNQSFSGASAESAPLVSIQDSGNGEALHVSSQSGIPATFTNTTGGKLISGRSVSGVNVTENFSVDTSGNIFSTGAVITQYRNAPFTSGTTLNHLVILLNSSVTGGPALWVTDAPTTANGGVVGVVVGGAGQSGYAQVALSGTAACTFDGPSVIGNYVGISKTVQGACADVGFAYPASGQVIGRVLDANSGTVLLFGPEHRAGLDAAVTSINTGSGLTGGPITSTGTISIADGGVTNSMLQNSWINIITGAGLSGGAAPYLGGQITLTNTGVLSFNGRSGAVGPNPGDYSFSQISGSVGGPQMPALTGDITSAAGTTVTALAPSGVTAGTYTKMTVDAKGRATSGAQASFSDLSGSAAATQMPALSGDITSAAGSTTTALAPSGVTAGTYTKVTVDAKGRATAGTQAAFSDLGGSASASQLPAAVVYNNQANTFTASQTVNGTVSATLFSGSGAGLSGVNAASLNGLASGSFAQLAAANSFTAKQTLPASSASSASLNVPAGVAPSVPATGDVWNTGSVLQYRDNASTTRSLVSTTQSGGMQLLKLTSSITPASVAVNSCAEQSFTISGINTSDMIFGVSQPSTSSPGSNIAIGGFRVSAANTVAIQFCNVGKTNTSTPAAGTYTIAIMR